MKFNGRFYAGKQISCQFCNVTNWKVAICGKKHSITALTLVVIGWSGKGAQEKSISVKS